MNVTLVVALIAAIAAIVAPVISSAITVRGTHKTKTLELFFAAKSTAYEDLLAFTSKYPEHDTAADMEELQNRMSRALLYSSPSTQAKVASYCKALLDGTPSGTEYRDALLAMQSELRGE